MKTYRRLRVLAMGLLALECVIGFGGALTARHEVFPFASWFLFGLIPDKESDYDLILRAEGERPLDPPPSFSHAPGALVQGSHSVVSHQLIQQLGDADAHHDDARLRALRRQIEAQFRVPFIHYDLVRVVYRPVAYWETGQVISRSAPMRSFVAGEDVQP